MACSGNKAAKHYFSSCLGEQLILFIFRYLILSRTIMVMLTKYTFCHKYISREKGNTQMSA